MQPGCWHGGHTQVSVGRLLHLYTPCLSFPGTPTWRSSWQSRWWREERTFGCHWSRTGTRWWRAARMTGCQWTAAAAAARPPPWGTRRADPPCTKREWKVGEGTGLWHSGHSGVGGLPVHAEICDTFGMWQNQDICSAGSVRPGVSLGEIPPQPPVPVCLDQNWQSEWLKAVTAGGRGVWEVTCSFSLWTVGFLPVGPSGELLILWDLEQIPGRNSNNRSPLLQGHWGTPFLFKIVLISSVVCIYSSWDLRCVHQESGCDSKFLTRLFLVNLWCSDFVNTNLLFHYTVDVSGILNFRGFSKVSIWQ